MSALLHVGTSFNGNSRSALSGMAIMSTHPKDYDQVLQLSVELPQKSSVHVVPCLGIHPWFLHEVTEDDWQTDPLMNVPKWLVELEKKLLDNPNAIVGEIGLDGFHFDAETKELVSPMAKQIDAFEMQMQLAAKLKRPVSVHAVHCFGPLMESVSRLKKSCNKLPPKIYFHAFAGKAGTVDQLLALCGRQPGHVYFGFAPVINFRSPKTPELVRKIGIDRLLLETDHEEAALVPESIERCIDFIHESLGMERDEIITKTTENAYEFYGLRF